MSMLGGVAGSISSVTTRCLGGLKRKQLEKERSGRRLERSGG